MSIAEPKLDMIREFDIESIPSIGMTSCKGLSALFSNPLEHINESPKPFQVHNKLNILLSIFPLSIINYIFPFDHFPLKQMK